MSRWFRHYAGMMRDEKLVSAAVKAKQPVERVVWVWGALLESASEINDNGRYEFDAGEAAYFLRCDDADLVSILACLEGLGRLSGGVVVRWGDRQYSSDTAAERQRRYRERKSANPPVHDNDRNDHRDSDVTVASRDDGVTPQETDTELEAETDQKESPPVAPAGGGAGEMIDVALKVFPRSPHTNEAKFERAFRRLPIDQQVAFVAAVHHFATWFTEEQARRKRSVAEALPFAPPLDKWLGDGAWKSALALPLNSQAKPAIATTRLDRERDRDLWLACEQVMGKPAPTSGFEWAFLDSVIAKAREASAA